MENGLKYIIRSAHKTQSSQMFSENVNPELDHKVKKVTEKFSENLHLVANEPSVAYYRIQEHVRRSLPQLTDTKQQIQELQQEVQGSCFDMEYGIKAVKGMHQSSTHFQNIQDLLKNAMFMKQQIMYEQSRKNDVENLTKRQQEKLKPSMYRSIMRNNTVDVPMSEPPSGGNEDQINSSQSMQIPTPNRRNNSPRHLQRSSSLEERK